MEIPAVKERDEELVGSPKESDVLGLFLSDDSIDDRSKEIEGGKLIPDKDEASYEFFGKKVEIKQQLNQCGGHIWRCATVIMDYFQNQDVFPGDHFRGKKVVEVGAGTGVTGIGLAMGGANVTLTDQKHIVPLLEQNVLSNGLTLDQVKVAELSW